MPPSTLWTSRYARHCPLQVLCPSGPKGALETPWKIPDAPTNESLMAMMQSALLGGPCLSSSYPPSKSPQSLPLSSRRLLPSPSACVLYQENRSLLFHSSGSSAPSWIPIHPSIRQHPHALPARAGRLPVSSAGGWMPGLPSLSPVLGVFSPQVPRVSAAPASLQLPPPLMANFST